MMMLVVVSGDLDPHPGGGTPCAGSEAWDSLSPEGVPGSSPGVGFRLLLRLIEE
jgi:hypothetical protein